MKCLKLNTAFYFTGQGKYIRIQRQSGSPLFWLPTFIGWHQIHTRHNKKACHKPLREYWCIKFTDQVYNKLWLSMCLKFSATYQGMVGDNMRVDIKFFTNSQCKNDNHSHEAPSVFIRENRCGRIGAYIRMNPSISITWHIFGLPRLLVWPP